MNVEILSMQEINNMGSLLQAYGMKKIIEKLGGDVEYIKIKRIEDDYVLSGNYAQDFSDEFEERARFKHLQKCDRYTASRIVHREQEKKQNKFFDMFRKESLNIAKKSCDYDLCIIGSDEVFNCLNQGDWGFTSQLFGNVPEARRIITYAASCGSTSYKDVPGPILDKIRVMFQNIQSFSVRDDNTYDFVSQLSDKNISRNLDPVLIYDFSLDINNMIVPKITKKYCVIYSYCNRIHDKSEIDRIKKFCTKYDLEMVAIGAPQFWIKKFIVCTPFQCLKLFEEAEYVITDTFHGTIFSIRANVKFCTLIRKSNENKLNSLLKTLRRADRRVNKLGDIERLYKEEIDYSETNNIIEIEREKTMKYLKENMINE